MIHAYNENYLYNAENTMGTLFHVALSIMDPKTFSDLFLQSYVSKAWEVGNPSYLAGKSGIELLEEITGCGIRWNDDLFIPHVEYWCGMVYCRAQWQFGCSFERLFSVMPLDKMLQMFYPLHEADITKTTDIIHERLFPTSALKAWREKRCLSQSQLSRISGVNLRSIKAYEQGDLDIAKAQYESLANMAKAMNCKVSDLIS